MELDLLAAAAEHRMVVEGLHDFDDEASNRATTPAYEGMDSNRGSLVEEEMADAEMGELLPAGHFQPIGCPAPAPRVPTPILRPAVATPCAPAPSTLPIAMATVAQGASMFASSPMAMTMAQPMMPPMPQLAPNRPTGTAPCLAMTSAPAHPSYVQGCMPPSGSEPPIEPCQTASVPRPRLVDNTPAGMLGMKMGNVTSMPRCLGKLLACDSMHCDPNFVAVRVGNSSRFEHKFCNHCRASGIPVQASRVRLLNPAYEAAFCVGAGSQGNQHKRFWCYSPTAPERFHIFNDKARCSGPKVVVFESPTTAETEAMMRVPLAANAPVGEDGEAVVRLWISYGTLTLQRSRKAFRPDDQRA